jgi:DNA-binding CsgD family transcriptional regulator
MSPRLLKRELFVLERVAYGEPSSAIAATLGCSVDAVKRLRRQLLGKLGAPTSAAAVRCGFELGLLGTAGVQATPELISDGQLRAFYAKCGQLDSESGWKRGTTARMTLDELGEQLGRELDDARDLTVREAHDALDRLTLRLRGDQ